ncbi:MAG: M15 family metallopeptidase [Akkermansiaceae bacterium]|nr:M15 family metallopeptidase [Akkermansiaceae bacterium]
MRTLTLVGLCSLTVSCSQHFSDVESTADALPVSNNHVLAKAGLVRVAEVDRSIHVDLQYKGATTLSKKPFYEPSFPALLRPETARRLSHANRLVKAYGYRIMVWDAYRPPIVQNRLWDASGHNDTYVANPHNAASQHSCGTAVDVTMVTSRGKPVKMPTGFDSFSPLASSNYQHKDPEIRRNLNILQSAMRQAGFYPLPAEWWHYIDKNYEKYPNTISLESIKGSY